MQTPLTVLSQVLLMENKITLIFEVWGLRDYGVGGQIGLEKTPEEYVAKLVEVCREVRRVLKKEGTFWLNLGDSYSGGGRGSGYSEKQDSNRGTVGMPKSIVANGLKHKDLVGIPWAVAKALQQPYYTGKIKDEKDRVWLAAMIDGEGCMFIHKRKAGELAYSKYTKKNGEEMNYSRTQDNYGAGLEVANTKESIIKRCQEITGVGSICFQDKESKLKNRNQRLYRWNMRNNECRNIIQEIYPYLVGKKHEARLVLGCPSSGEEARKAHESLIALHNGKEATIDFPEPSSLYEKGFYLRQDIIWSKNNPMPESVTDRCTKSHEYVFLLTKSQKYFYDHEAIKTKMECSEHDKRAREGRKRTPTALVNGIRGGNEKYYEYANKRSVWTVCTKPFKEAHFATFPEALIEPMVKAGCPEFVCNKCGKAREALFEKGDIIEQRNPEKGKLQDEKNIYHNEGLRDGFELRANKKIGLTDCGCNAGFSKGIVLDIFMGAGTTAVVAKKQGRHYLGIELNPKYVEIARKRLEKHPVRLDMIKEK
jgi:DNA modification methylase